MSQFQSAPWLIYRIVFHFSIKEFLYAKPAFVSSKKNSLVLKKSKVLRTFVLNFSLVYRDNLFMVETANVLILAPVPFPFPPTDSAGH